MFRFSVEGFYIDYININIVHIVNWMNVHLLYYSYVWFNIMQQEKHSAVRVGWSELNQGLTHQAQVELVCHKEYYLSTKNKKALPNIYIATYNIRSLSDQTRLTNLEQELINIRWNVIGLPEIRTGDPLLKTE